ncbi:MAG: transposase [Chloroflexi bacterium]|nr:transposase [Chloroflexota bacterium]
MNRAPTVGDIVRVYKAASARLIRQSCLPEFAWQRNYYEHVIRDELSLARIRQYIAENPLRWLQDAENPDNTVASALGGKKSKNRKA